MPLSVSPSIVASYEYWRSMEPGDSWPTEDDIQAKLDELVAQIKGEPFEPPEAMLLGRAWHEALERVGGAEMSDRTFEVDGYTFDIDSLRVVTDKQPLDLIRELRGELHLPEIGVVMKLRVDGIRGTEIHEIKTTSRIDAERYMHSLQWRCYLLAFHAMVVVYHLCRLKRDRRTGIYSLGEYVPFRQFAYQGMRDDVIRRVGACAEFIREQGLTEYRTIDQPTEVELCA